MNDFDLSVFINFTIIIFFNNVTNNEYEYGRPVEELDVETLDIPKDSLLDSLTVVLDCHRLTHAGIEQMADAIIARTTEDARVKNLEAKTSLYFELCDPLKNYVVKLYSRKHKAHITTDLIDFLRAQDGATVRINNRLVEDLVTVQEETAEDEEMLDAADMLPDD